MMMMTIMYNYISLRIIVRLLSYVLMFQVSGVSNEIFRQIEMVENDHDATTAAALEVRKKIHLHMHSLRMYSQRE